MIVKPKLSSAYAMPVEPHLTDAGVPTVEKHPEWPSIFVG
jgi:hypothetical protein